MTEYEANLLIKKLKNLVSACKTLMIPNMGDKKIEEIVSIADKDFFKIYIYRGSKENKKITFHAIECLTGNAILRLDINATKHMNPDGREISENHLHIYKDGYEIKYAEEFNIEDDDLIKITLDFFKMFKVIDVLGAILKENLFS